MRGLPQLMVLLLILLLPSSAVCVTCLPDRCPMPAKPEPVAAAKPASCHQMYGHDTADQTAVASASLQLDCCAVTAEPEDEAPAVLTTAPAGVVSIAAVDGPEAAPEPGAPARPRWTPPPHPPLYHLHSSLLI